MKIMKWAKLYFLKEGEKKYDGDADEQEGKQTL